MPLQTITKIQVKCAATIEATADEGRAEMDRDDEMRLLHLDSNVQIKGNLSRYKLYTIVFTDPDNHQTAWQQQKLVQKSDFANGQIVLSFGKN